MSRRNAIIRIALISGIIILLNFLGDDIYFRLDLTEDQRYTLSQATKDVVEEISEPVTVKAYFSEEMTPQNQKVRSDFEDMLKEYQNLADGDVVYEFINPNESEESEIEAQQKGIAPVMEDVRERDQISKRRVYMGAEIIVGDRSGLIPAMNRNTPMEYELTKEIKKLIVPEKPKIGMIGGHGEAGKEEAREVSEMLGVLYDVEDWQINDSAGIPDYYRAIIMINPSDTVPAEHLRQIDQYLSSGGNMFLAMNTVETNIGQQKMQALPPIGVLNWLSQKGITIDRNYVYDEKCGTVVARQQMGFMTVNNQIPFPWFPFVFNFADHPVTKGLEAILLPIASTVKADESLEQTVLMRSSEKSGITIPPQNLPYDGTRFLPGQYNQSNLPLAIAVQGALGAEGSVSKMVVVGNGGFFLNPRGQRGRIEPRDNVFFAVNAIDWLSDDTGLIELRTKIVTRRPLKSIEDSTRLIYKYGNFFAPILLMLVIGFIRFRINKAKREKWRKTSMAGPEPSDDKEA